MCFFLESIPLDPLPPFIISKRHSLNSTRKCLIFCSVRFLVKWWNGFMFFEIKVMIIPRNQPKFEKFYPAGSPFGRELSVNSTSWSVRKSVEKFLGCDTKTKYWTFGLKSLSWFWATVSREVLASFLKTSQFSARS
jgi:hypothetical protein